MLSNQWMRALALSLPVITAALLLGITKSVFQIEASTNLFNSGILLGTVLGIGQVILAILVWKHRT